MKSKKLLLVGVAAMGLAAVGVGGVSSLAWYQVTAGSVNYSAATKEDITTVANSYSLGDFDVVCTITGFSGEVDLTDDTGHTYYYLPDGTTKVDAGMAANPTTSGTIGFTITYKGTGLSDVEIAALWASDGVDSITITVEGTNKVKVGTSSSGAYGASAANSINWAVDVSAATFSSKVYTYAGTTVYAGAEGVDSVETAGARGNVVATPSETPANP